VVISSALLSRFAVKVQKSEKLNNNIIAKGVAEKNIVSDVGAFECTVSCTAKDITSGYAEINRLTRILDLKFREVGIQSDWVENVSINFSPVYKTVRSREGNRETSQEVFSHYSFTRSCRVRSSQVKILENASVQLYSLTAAGININISSVEYFISNPEQYKLELIDSATQSAYQRAKVMAEKCGSKLGNLTNARQGVIQITRPASNDTSDYGTYDTRTINKVMRVVVTLDFELAEK
jgi:hypothetical protein